MAFLSVPCTVIKVRGHDIYGAEVLGSRVKERCGVVKLYKSSEFTTVRVDSGASRGAAFEGQGFAQLLLSPSTVAQINDLLFVGGIRLRVTKKWPRFDVFGKTDHYEIECGID